MWSLTGQGYDSLPAAGDIAAQRIAGQPEDTQRSRQAGWQPHGCLPSQLAQPEVQAAEVEHEGRGEQAHEAFPGAGFGVASRGQSLDVAGGARKKVWRGELALPLFLPRPPRLSH